MRNKWPIVKLGEVVTPAERAEVPEVGKTYRQIGVQLWGKGAYEREPMDGAQTKYSQLFRAEAGDIIVNKIWARNGSVAIVSELLAGCFGSGEFPMFAPKSDCLDSRWMHWLTKTPSFWAQCDEKSRGTSGKNRIKPEQFLKVEIPLPPLIEQRLIVARIEQLAAQIHQARTLREQAVAQVENLFISKFKAVVQKCGNQARKLPFTDITKLERRPVVVKLNEQYREIGVYCFGKGIFHKQPRLGADVGGKDLYEIRADDFILQITFAWEGAVALARKADDGLFGSVRYLTFRVNENICNPRYLLTYMKTPEAIAELVRISPGSAGRNRVLKVKRLNELLVPIVPLEAQKWLNDELQAEVDALKHQQAETAAELDALLPSILDKAFKGEL